MTPSEVLLWEYLRKKPLGYKFRRQHPLGQFIADFYCYALKLVIEVDGNIHDSPEAKEKDGIRQGMIESDGIKVIRFRNEEVNSKLETVIELIENNIIKLKK
jgi:cyclase